MFLCETLFENNNGIYAAIDAVKKELKSEDDTIVFYAKNLQRILKEKGKWPEQE